MHTGFDGIQTHWQIFLNTEAQPDKGLLERSFTKEKENWEEFEWCRMAGQSLGFDFRQPKLECWLQLFTVSLAPVFRVDKPLFYCLKKCICLLSVFCSEIYNTIGLEKFKKCIFYSFLDICNLVCFKKNFFKILLKPFIKKRNQEI